ncbi:hypothetical protein [Rathayibacter festucae]|uniref:hypothetical protein n=1 Tax=Rathayibacter festucae TaxID=110937 RepID=UPI002A6AE44C|nr:hypothetical protein [Rathayibacter festucae]MDY0912313.1 hypothetical protein [Rathayibacter festucae]
MGEQQDGPASRADTAVRRGSLTSVGIFVAGLLLYCAASVWSAIEYNVHEAAGALDVTPSAAAVQTSNVAIALIGVGLIAALAGVSTLIVRSRRG